MGNTQEFRSTGTSEVRLCQLSSTEWRVLDGRFEPTELRALLGFIHAGGDGFEVVRMDSPNAGIVFASLAEAKAEFIWHPIAAGYLGDSSSSGERSAAGDHTGRRSRGAKSAHGRMPVKA